MIRVESLFEIDSCDDWGTKPVGFYCEGHVDAGEFLKSEILQEYLEEYNEYRDPDFEDELALGDLSQVQHIYWAVEKLEPDEPDCDCEIFVRCNATYPGAVAVTVIDI